MTTIVTRLWHDDSGATAIEYGLIAAVIGLGIIVGLGALRDGLNDIFNNVTAELSN